MTPKLIGFKTKMSNTDGLLVSHKCPNGQIGEQYLIGRLPTKTHPVTETHAGCCMMDFTSGCPIGKKVANCSWKEGFCHVFLYYTWSFCGEETITQLVVCVPKYEDSLFKKSIYLYEKKQRERK